MGFTLSSARIWPVTPDWSGGMQEALQWGTNVTFASATAVSQHASYRYGPRRALSFQVLSGKAERRIAEMLLAGHSGAWQLPIWPDVQWLTAPVAAASASIPCATLGFDFVVGGKALLYAAVNTWEVVTIDAIASDHIGLVDATVSAFGAGSRLYPLRRAKIGMGAEEVASSDEVARRTITASIDEHCDWPTLVDPTQYLDHLVLDVRPDESDNPSHSFDRLLQGVDYGYGLPFSYDLPDQALRAQSSSWKLFGRAQHSWFRSLLYTLDGRRVPIWVPSFNNDIQPVAAIAGGSTSVSIQWAGYTLFGKDRHNRRDLRIELTDGAVFYRRITNAVEAGAAETLTLNASLDAGSIAPERIRSVSFMALSTLASDQIEIDHVTDQDGVAKSTTGWQAVVPDA